jgi:hypothetical protein
MTGSKGTDVTITGTSFIGTRAVTLCGVSQAKFSILNDTRIRLTVADLGLTSSKQCDMVVTNPVGNSSISSSNEFTYAAQSGSGGATSHAPNSPTNSNKTLYIAIAGVAAVVLISMSEVIRRRGSRGKA